MKRKKLMLAIVILLTFLFVLPAYAVFCSKCGTQNPDDAVYCGKCGMKLYHPAESEEKVNIYKQSSDLIERERFDEAISLLEPHYKSNRTDTRAKILLADAYLGKCDLLKENGDEQYKTLVLKPFALGEGLIVQYPYPSDPHYLAEGLYIYAYSLLINNRNLRASRNIKKALSISPSDTPKSRYYVILGSAKSLLAIQNDNDEQARQAIGICRNLIDMNPPNDHKAIAYYWIGTLQSKFYSKKEAVKNLNTALGYAEKESTRMRIEKQLASIQKIEKGITRKPSPKLEGEKSILLRANPEKVSDVYVAGRIKDYNLYDAELNESGSFTNDFVDNGDGTITDKRTGLMWEKGGSPTSRSLKRARSYVKNLNKNRFAGYSDWRLPTIEELASLLESHKTNDMYIDPLFDSKQASCWSSDSGPEFGGDSQNPPQIWHVKFREGTIGLQVVTVSGRERKSFRSHIYVRAVRSLTD